MDQASDSWNANPHPTGPPARERASSPLGPLQWAYLQRHYELTPREVQIAQLVCQGLRNSRVAESLNIQPATVQVHVRNIYRKMKVKSKISMLLRFIEETGRT